MRHSVIRHHVNGWADPAAIFTALYGEADNSFWLDSGIHAVAGMSYMGIGSRTAIASVAEENIRLEPGGGLLSGTIFDFLQSELPAAGIDKERGEPDVSVEVAAGFQLGWVGWLGYELRHQTMQSSAGETSLPRPSRYPDAALVFVDRVIAFDHEARTVTLVALGDSWTGPLRQWRDSTVAAIGMAVREVSPSELEPPSTTGELGSTPVRWRYSADEYLAMIRHCQTAIRAGDAYQLCLTTEAALDIHPDPVTTYLALRQSSPSHHGGFLRIAGVCLLSSSPERFMSVSPNGVIESKPIKGTRRRGATLTEDAALISELESSDKERAENLMIVDLMRNDIGRVSATGSVTVPTLLRVESYAQVHQLVSTVRGRLADGMSSIDAVVACFPAGSMTGAPKLSATQILDRLEQLPRGIYSGAFGYFSLDGGIDLAMVIRSIVLDAEGATVGSGGGITALSVPEEELAEVQLKAAALLAVLSRTK